MTIRFTVAVALTWLKPVWNDRTGVFLSVPVLSLPMQDMQFRFSSKKNKLLSFRYLRVCMWLLCLPVCVCICVCMCYWVCIWCVCDLNVFMCSLSVFMCSVMFVSMWRMCMASVCVCVCVNGLMHLCAWCARVSVCVCVVSWEIGIALPEESHYDSCVLPDHLQIFRNVGGIFSHVIFPGQHLSVPEYLQRVCMPRLLNLHTGLGCSSEPKD